MACLTAALKSQVTMLKTTMRNTKIEATSTCTGIMPQKLQLCKINLSDTETTHISGPDGYDCQGCCHQQWPGRVVLPCRAGKGGVIFVIPGHKTTSRRSLSGTGGDNVVFQPHGVSRIKLYR